MGRIVEALADVPGVVAVVLGNHVFAGTATASSDYDLGLYFSARQSSETDGLLAVAKTVLGDTGDTGIGDWGPWIV